LLHDRPLLPPPAEVEALIAGQGREP
jgi:hypothetical protein